ncbi:MAG TPA: phosphoribosylformylglycinamidine cyclo-ligase [Tissierellaceae bacterium]
MSLTYKDAGVDKEAGYKQVSLIKEHIKKTHSKNVLSQLGGFSGLYQLDNNLKEPVLVSGTDGVGTKLKIAFLLDKHDTIGEDAVAMCVNDIICQGAKPLFFLDYIATGKLVPEKMADVVKGVSNGCIKGKCSLIGGETAEMPGFYTNDEYDIAGFAVGVVEKSKIITGNSIEDGDIVIGLPSSGIHSNGYSLVRKIVFDKMNFDKDSYIEKLDKTILEELLTPTRIYTYPMLNLIERFDIKGISHITGGGFYENIPRMLPEGLQANVDTKVIDTPVIFDLLQEWGNINKKEMYSTFNMGVGMIFVIKESDKEQVCKYLEEIDEKYYVLGNISKGSEGEVLC